jgi:leucyl-tRNA synthetase
MPVDVYIGGEEHAITHLFVARLISHFLHNQNKLVNKEPFQRFISIGMVKGECYKTKTGKYVEPSHAVQKGTFLYLKL